MTAPRLRLAFAATLLQRQSLLRLPSLLRRPILVATQLSGAGLSTRPGVVRVIVPFGAGGQADVTDSLIGQPCAENFGKPLVVETAPGRRVIGRWRRGTQSRRSEAPTL